MTTDTLNFEAHIELASNFRKKGQWHESLEQYQAAIRINPDSWETLIAIADILLNLEQWDESAVAYQKSLEINQNFDWAWHNLAVVYGKLGRWGDVEDCHAHLFQLKPDFLSFNQSIPLVAKHQSDYQEWKSLQSSNLNDLEIDSLQASQVEVLNGGIHHAAANFVVGWVNKDSLLSAEVGVQLIVDGKAESYVIANLTNLEVHVTNSSIRGRCWFKLFIPDQYLDGHQHDLKVLTDNGSVIGELKHKFAVQGHLDTIQSGRVIGWILAPGIDFPLELDLYLDGKIISTFVANNSRVDVNEKFGYGFDVFFRNTLHAHQTIKITLKGSNICLFDTPKVVFSSIGAIDALHQVSQSIRMDKIALEPEKKDWLLNHLVPQLVQGFRDARRTQTNLNIQLNKDQIFDLNSVEPVAPKTVDIVIPVYKNYAVTKRCIEAAIHSKNITSFNVLVINDKSPEPVIHDYLRELSENGSIELLINEENKGFVHSVNRGMKLHQERDIVLLNSDAIVSDYWLDRLRSAAYQDVNIASATPLSNHASIFSYPRMCKEVGHLPDDVTSPQLSVIADSVNNSAIVSVPAMHGFCCYLKRSALSHIGFFDEIKWGKGYGEEVDWSQRARLRGWQHVSAPGVFVEHVGSQSFTDTKEKSISNALKKLSNEFPEFDAVVQDFISQDPLAPYRRKIDIKRLMRFSEKYILYISHDFGGGTRRHIVDMSERLGQEGFPVLCLAPSREGWVQIFTPTALDSCSLYQVKYDSEIQALVEDLMQLGVFHIHVHSPIGFEDETLPWQIVSRLKLPYDVTIHDYYFICPRVNLSLPNNRYCGEPSEISCNSCIVRNGLYDSRGTQNLFSSLGSIRDWREFFKEKLSLARKIYAPSNDAKIRILKYFPQLEVDVKPHLEIMQGTEKLESKVDLTNSIHKYKVAIIGAISDIKGYNILRDCASFALHFHIPIEFTIFGFTKNDQELEEFSNIHFAGKYKTMEELQILVEDNPCDIAAFLSTWPETYSYTLSEAIQMGLVPVGFDIGAFSERISLVSKELLIDIDSPIEVIVQKLISACEMGRSQNFSYQFPESHRYVSILEDYYSKKL